jgi:23S rRNA (uracil1939-C5)-methyltransferase
LEKINFLPRKYLPIQPSPLIFGYRNRIQLRQENHRLGFFKKRSHEIVDIRHCAVAAPALNDEMERVRAEKAPAAGRKLEIWVGGDGSIGRLVDSPHGSGGFRQVNEAQNEFLRDRVAAHVKAFGAKKVLELFCGDGNLTFRFLPSIERVIGIDSNGAAIERARSVGEGKADFLCLPVGYGTIRKLPADFADRYDTLVLDPPRQGVGRAIEAFLHRRLNAIIYVSCSPLSFATDVQSLRAKGFVPEEIQALDMFPHTRHIEFVAVLVRE